MRKRKDGVRLTVSMTASPVLTAGPIEGYIIYRDITERKRAEALIAGEKRILEMIAKGEPLRATLEALCRLVEEESSGATLLDSVDGRGRQAAAARCGPRSAGQPTRACWTAGRSARGRPCAVAAHQG